MNFLLPPWLEALHLPFVSAIVIMALVAATFLLRNTFIYLREDRWLKCAERHSAAHASDAETFFLTLSKDPTIHGRGVAWRRVLDVRRLALSHVPVDVGALSELADAHESALFRNSLPNFIVSSLLIIGLGGTFIALNHMLRDSPLQQALATPSGGATLDTRAIQDSIRNIYSGFGGAFNTSIWGIGATVALLLVRVVIVSPLREGFFARLDHWTQCSLIPLYQGRTEAPGSALDTAASRLENVAGALLEVSRTMAAGAEASGQAVRDLTAYTGELAKIIGALDAMLGEDSHLQRMLEQMLKLLGDADQQHRELCARMDSQIQEGRRSNGEVTVTRKALEAVVNRHNEALTAFGTAVGRARGDFTEAMAKANQRLDAESRQRSKESEETVLHADKLLTRLEESQRRADTEWLRVMTPAADLKPVLDTVLARLQAIEATLLSTKEFPARFEGALGVHGPNGAGSGSLREILDLRFGELAGLSRQSVETLSVLRESLGKRIAEEASRGQTGPVMQGAAGLSTEVRGLRQDFAAVVASLQTIATQTRPMSDRVADLPRRLLRRLGR